MPNKTDPPFRSSSSSSRLKLKIELLIKKCVITLTNYQVCDIHHSHPHIHTPRMSRKRESLLRYFGTQHFVSYNILI